MLSNYINMPFFSIAYTIGDFNNYNLSDFLFLHFHFGQSLIYPLCSKIKIKMRIEACFHSLHEEKLYKVGKNSRNLTCS